MNILPFRAAFAVIFALTTLSLASPSSAQQKTSPWPQQPPALSQSQPPALSAQAAPPAQAPAPAVDAQPAPTPATSDTTAAPDGSRSLKSTTVALRELSSLLSAAMREARLSAGISSDTGIKERAGSSFAEIVRAEARRIRLGMGVLATIGATAPFVGLFGTVWGIMNSFIGISKSQTTNLAVVAPGIAEALLATAFGLAAAIPAVIIYNHFTRMTKGYLELVGRSSGAAGRLLSRDLDRTHGSSHSRAAE